jgi:hypothetical protein
MKEGVEGKGEQRKGRSLLAQQRQPMANPTMVVRATAMPTAPKKGSPGMRRSATAVV